MTNWELFHKYRRLVEEGKAKPLICPDDTATLISRIGPDDEPVLWCHACLSSIRPGAYILQQVRAVVSEHFV